MSTFTGCKKDDDEEPKPKTKSELLTGPNWRVSAITNKIGANPPTDLYARQPSCSKDDFYKFTPEKIFRLDEGATKCNTSNPQTTENAWDITADGGILLLFERKGSTEANLYEVVELSDTKLTIRQSDISGGQTEQFDITFTAF